MGFNVDRKFSNVLDGLVVVDLRRTEPAVLERYMGREPAASRFREVARHIGGSLLNLQAARSVSPFILFLVPAVYFRGLLSLHHSDPSAAGLHPWAGYKLVRRLYLCRAYFQTLA